MDEKFEKMNNDTPEIIDDPVLENNIDEVPVEAVESEPEYEETEETCEPVKETKPVSEDNSYGGFSQKWTYEKAKKRGRGLVIFASVVSALFLMTLSAFVTYYVMNEKHEHKILIKEETNIEASVDEKKEDVSVNASIKDELHKAEERVENKTDVKYTGEVLTRQEIIELTNPSVVGIKTQVQGYGYFGTTVYEGVGSGFILTESGYIVTNYHVVEDAMSIKVVLENGNEYEATLVGGDELSDLAVLKIEPEEELQKVVIGDSSKIVAGDSVVAIGCPSGIELSGTATSGMVSKANRELSITDSYGRVQKTMYVIQIDAPINPGNSGGPLINDRGEVIGINTLKLSSTYEGIGFALPINGVIDIVNQLCEDGIVSERGESSYVKGKAAIGISYYYDITEKEAKYSGVHEGMQIVMLTPEGAAQKAGLERGDIIIAYNGDEIENSDDLREKLAKSSPRDEVEITVWRDGEKLKIKVVLDEA